MTQTYTPEQRALASALRDHFRGDPSRWCRGTAARDAAGFAVEPRHEHARAWCLTGACVAVASNRHEAFRALSTALDLYADDFVETVEAWNDDSRRTFADVDRFLKTVATW